MAAAAMLRTCRPGDRGARERRRRGLAHRPCRPLALLAVSLPAPMRGVRATWQAITWDGAAGFQLSNPSFRVLR